MSTKKSWNTVSPDVADPSRPSALLASAVRRHDVMESAIVRAISARPLASVMTAGSTNSVSGNQRRTRGPLLPPSAPFSLCPSVGAAGSSAPASGGPPPIQSPSSTQPPPARS